jgi:hypothetical protein
MVCIVIKNTAEVVQKIITKMPFQLIYWELENVNGLTREQYEVAIEKYPIMGEIYSKLREFYRIVFSQ